MNEHRTFATERLILRPTSVDDAEFLYQLMNTPKFLLYIGDRNVGSVQQAQAYIESNMLPQLQKRGFSAYTMITKAKHEKIGTCGLYDREGVDGIDLGFALLPPHEGMGYGYESSSRLIQAAFEEFALRELKAITTKTNTSSQRLLEKLGFEKVGVKTLPDGHEELFLYRIEKKSHE